MDKRREGRPGDARAALRRSVRENGSDIAEQSGEAVSRSMAGSMISRFCIHLFQTVHLVSLFCVVTLLFFEESVVTLLVHACY